MVYSMGNPAFRNHMLLAQVVLVMVSSCQVCKANKNGRHFLFKGYLSPSEFSISCHSLQLVVGHMLLAYGKILHSMVRAS